MGREPVPSAGVIDSQSVKAIESGGPRGRRRLAKDFEATIESALAGVNLAAVRLLTRRLARA